jgi:hypothetical protein
MTDAERERQLAKLDKLSSDLVLALWRFRAAVGPRNTVPVLEKLTETMRAEADAERAVKH